MHKQKKLKNKEALEFVLVNRGIDDPNYDNPNAPSKILLHVPKEESGQLKQEHDRMLEEIPEISRGVYGDEAIQNREMDILGLSKIVGSENPKEIKEKLDEMHKENMIKKVQIDMSKKEVIKFQKNSKVTEVEEIVDTNFNKKAETKQELDDKKIDKLLEKAKIQAEIVEYNEFGLRKDINPEVLEYVTNREFREGVDIFIPAANYDELVKKDNFDIDIDPNDMNADYKEVYDALNNDEDEGDELEDDFVLLANEGKIPIEMIKESKKDEIVISELSKKQPSYKYITKEEQEMLNKQFSSTFKEYTDDKDKDNKTKKGTYAPKEVFNDAINEILTKSKNTKNKIYGLTAKYQDEDEYEDYELDEDGDCEEFEEIMEEEEKEEEELNNNYDENLSDDENQFTNKVIIEEKLKNLLPYKKEKQINNDDEFTLNDLNKLMHDKNFVEKTIELVEQLREEKEEEEIEYPVYYATKKLDITSVHGTFGNLPKSINVEVKKEATIVSNKPEKEEQKILLNPKSNKVDTIVDGETKEQKKLRKKMLKEETKEKRKQKKELKQAFTVKYLNIIIIFNFLV